MLPIIRSAFGIDDAIQIQFFTAIMLLIGGLMCGLTGMLLLVKRQPQLPEASSEANSKHADTNSQAAMIHASGLLIFTGIPLANFLACYFIWVNTRSESRVLDTHGREAICQQITLYLYLLVSMFMALLIVGVFAALLLLLLHLVFTIIAIIKAKGGAVFRYPANISIIDRHILPTPLS
ncbi:hypothetical protein NBRC116583_01600 [Arenicella sp. 4NH20-0111]